MGNDMSDEEYPNSDELDKMSFDEFAKWLYDNREYLFSDDILEGEGVGIPNQSSHTIYNEKVGKIYQRIAEQFGMFLVYSN